MEKVFLQSTKSQEDITTVLLIVDKFFIQPKREIQNLLFQFYSLRAEDIEKNEI